MERVTPLYKVVLLGDEYMLTAPEFYQLQGECQEIAQFGNPASVRIDKEGITFKSFSGGVMAQIKSGAKLEDPTGCAHCRHQDQDTSEFDHVADEPEIVVELDPVVVGQEIIRSPSKKLSDLHSGLRDSREFLLTKSPHKAIQEEAQQGMALQTEIDQTISRLPDPDKMLELQEEITVIDPVKTAMDVEILKQKVEQMDKPKKRGRPTKIDKSQKPLAKDQKIENLDPETKALAALAMEKYSLPWAGVAKRIWCLGRGLTKEQVASVLPKQDPSKLWGYYRETHKEA